ncbi:MAG: hypothetical protein RDV48_07005 [Candidatus Eremiobacteraeota bacterium]|nr:hypothetical protein [Candidatus Eremiobacteraeota bacterium]
MQNLGSGGEIGHYMSYKMRPSGILEHLHASALYIGIGLLASVIIYFIRDWKPALLLIILNFLALFVSGGRIALALTLIALFVMIVAVYKKSQLKEKIRNLVALFILSILILLVWCVSLSLYYPSVKDYLVNNYVLLITQGKYDTGPNMNIVKLFFIEVERFISNFCHYPWAFPFGVGMTSLINSHYFSCEDFYVLQIMGQYGLIGAMIFYSLCFISMWQWGKCLSRLNGDDYYITLFAGIVLSMLLLTMLHSPVLLRKSIYPLFFFSLGIIQFYHDAISLKER